MSTAICMGCGQRIEVITSTVNSELRWLAVHKRPPALNGASQGSGRCYGGIKAETEAS